MRKIGKVALAYILAVTMCFSVVNVPVYAQGSKVTEVSTETTSEAVTEEATVSGNDVESTTEEVVATEETTTDGNDGNTWNQVTTENVYEGENYRVTFTLTSNWDAGYNANVKLENTGDSTIQNWKLGFDYNNSITNIWNAEVSSNEGNEYVIKNVGWNQDIAVGSSIEFGLSGDHAFKGFPENYELIGTSTEVTEDGYAIQYIVDGDWGTGFYGSISVTNNTDIALEDWVLEFDFDREITEIWDGVIEKHEDNHYVVRNAEYNSTIAPGESVSIGIKGCDGESSDEPVEFKLYSYRKAEEECVYNTDLSIKDTDGDGLNDYDEVITYGTNPQLIDTDEDKLDDFWEVKIGSNPLLYEESFSYTKTIEKDEISVTTVNVSVADITAEQVKTFDIGRVENDEFLNVNIPGYIDTGYEFSIEGTFDKAIVEISGEFEITEEFQPALYYFNEETQLLEYVSEQTIHNGKVVASLEHFSKYILLNKIEFDKVWTHTFLYDENVESYSGLDVVFVIDSSGSMSWNDSDNVRKTVTKEFINRLTDNDTAALISFDSSAITLANFTSDKIVLCNAVDKLDSSGGTSLSVGINSALNLFGNKEKAENRLQYIIMLTDGIGGYSTTYTTKAKNANIIINTIGLGNSVSQTVLANMAEGTGGNYYHVNQADELYYIFDTIAEKSDYYKDSDGDGLSDYYEKEMAAARLVLGTGIKMPVNYLDDDSDGDGLLDGEEVKVQKWGNIVYVKMYSNPKIVDTDNDGMRDDIESLPLVPNNVSEVLIHQTESGEGLKKKSEFCQNIVAEDLTFNDYSYMEIVGEVGVAGTVASDYNMSVTLMDMLEEFKSGNTRNIGKVVTVKDDKEDKFDSEMYNRFSDYTLTERAKNYSEFNTYLNKIKEIVVDELADNKGNLLELKCNSPRDGLIYDMAYDEIINYPVFSLKKDAALVLAIHDFQGHNITITDYKCDGKTFSGTLQFHFYDHFGLDSDDYEWAPGFCDWFTLQHYDRFNGEHSPYITVVDVAIEFSGVIE